MSPQQQLKRRVLIANIGLSDIYYNIGQEEPDFRNLTKPEQSRVSEALACQQGAWHISERLLEMLASDTAETVSRISYPLLHPVLQELATAAEPLDDVLLIGTNQADVSEHNHDTLNSAHVLKWLIERDFAGRVMQIEVRGFTARPTDEVAAYDWMGTLLRAIGGPRLEQITALYVEKTGGVPTLGNALTEQAQLLYESRAQIYTLKNLGGRPPRSQVVDSQPHRVTAADNPFLRDLSLKLVQKMLDRNDFGGALSALQPFASLFPAYEEVAAALNHASRRADFDFDGAANALKEWSGFTGHAQFEAWYNQVGPQRTPEARLYQQLVDAWALGVSYHRNGEYADMLWRVSTFYENGLRLLAARRWPELELIGKDQLRAEHIRKAYPGDRLVTYLRTENDQVRVNVWVLRRLCVFSPRLGDPQQTFLERQYQPLQLLKPLHLLRHGLVHELKGVSETTLNREFVPLQPTPTPHKQIMPTVKMILDRLGTKEQQSSADPFKAIKAYVRARLESDSRAE